MMIRTLCACLAIMVALPAAATPLKFDRSWKEQGFLRLFTNDYGLNGSTLDVVADGTVSLLWRAVPDGARGSTGANWAWSVSEGVGATDLSRKGGDDRNLAIYFAFTDTETAKSINPNRAAKLLRDENTRVLVYVWGGSKAGGPMQSPYLPGLKTIIKRPAGTGSHSESVDLARDFKRAFGTDIGVLVGVGVSADADDTGGVIKAKVSGLKLR